MTTPSGLPEEGLVIEWLGGNCPVQAEGTFDGQPFYFRSRGSAVTCEVGEWEWLGPVYEWPDAGWISEDVARAYILTALIDWRGRDSKYAKDQARRIARNRLRDAMMEHITWAARLDKVDGAAPVIAWHMAEAAKINQQVTEMDHEHS